MVRINMEGPARERVMQLIEEKERIERDIREETTVLTSNGNVGMHGPLVDHEGYPRSDIDVYKVRHARHRIICLQNDHKAVMKRIEEGLAEVHSALLPNQEQGEQTARPSTSQINISTANGHMNGSSEGPMYAHMNGHVNNGHINGRASQMGGHDHMNGYANVQMNRMIPPLNAQAVVPMDVEVSSDRSGQSNAQASANPQELEHCLQQSVVCANAEAFAVITLVVEGSPAAVDGLRELDEVLQFGSITNRNFVDISQVYNIVSHSVCNPIFVVVRRGGELRSLQVTPRAWAQQGLLGCQIVRKR